MNREQMLVQAGSVPLMQVGEGIHRRVLGHDADLMMVEVRFAKGAVGALHNHPNRQVTYVASGKFEVTIVHESTVLRAGDSFFVPPSAEHGVVALEGGTLVDVFSPARGDFLGPA